MHWLIEKRASVLVQQQKGLERPICSNLVNGMSSLNMEIAILQERTTLAGGLLLAEPD